MMTPGLRNILHDIAARDRAGTGVYVGPSNDRATAVRLKLIAGRPMKNGHRKKYYLTIAGQHAVETGKL